MSWEQYHESLQVFANKKYSKETKLPSYLRSKILLKLVLTVD